MKIVVNDDLLKGITKFNQTNAKQLKEMGSRTQMQLEASKTINQS